MSRIENVIFSVAMVAIGLTAYEVLAVIQTTQAAVYQMIK